jgi:hypothetical protein
VAWAAPKSTVPSYSAAAASVDVEKAVSRIERKQVAVDLEAPQQRLNGVLVTDEEIERERAWRANNCTF